MTCQTAERRGTQNQKKATPRTKQEGSGIVAHSGKRRGPMEKIGTANGHAEDKG